MPKATNFCFTYNIPDQAISASDARELFKPNEDVFYYCYQLERGENGGRLHLQGFAQTKTMAVSKFKSFFPTNGAHIEIAKAANLQVAADYCKKDDTRVPDGGPWEFGELRNGPAPGKRSDLDQVVTAIKEGATIKEIAVNHGATYVRNYRGLAALSEHVHPPPKRVNRAVDIWVYSGVTGSGKSRRARERCGERVYLKASEKWWCGYDHREHDFVLFEEFEGPEWLSPSELLQVLDRYSTTVQKRNQTSQELSCRQFVFTTNTGVKNWYQTTKWAKQWYEWDFEKNEEKQNCKYQAFMRRIDEGDGGLFDYKLHWDDQDELEHKRGAI